MSKFTPYANESDQRVIGNLTVENRIDRVSLFGDMDITRDKDGLALARELKTLIDGIVSTLEGEDLPEKLASPPIKKVKNPF